MADDLRARAHFLDDSPVEPVRIAKSRSSEVTFPTDVADAAALERALVGMANELAEGLRARARRARTIAIKVRLDDWTTVTRARTIERFTDEAAVDRRDLARTAAGLRTDATGSTARRSCRILRG